MLSPNLVSPKGKAASIWSIDSGYGSNTLEDEDALHLPANPGSSTAQRPSQPTQRPIGLGIQGLDFGGFWNVHVEDKLRLRRLESPANPITTKLNVFTTRDISTSTFTLPALSEDKATCITCQLWDLTNPGQGLKCDGCKSRDYVRPGVLHLFDTEHPEPEVQTAIPRLDIPKNSKPRHVLNRRNEARCSACELAHAMDPETSSTCASCTPGMDLLSPGSPILPSTVKRSCARRHTKLPSHVLHRLRTWLRANRDHPYPNAETKRALAQECGITEKQVTTWFTNTRARKLPLPEEPSHTSSEDEGTYESDYSSITNTPVCTTNPAFAYGTPTSNPTTQAFFGPTSYSTTQLPLHTFSRRGKKKDYRRVKTVSPVDDSPVSRLPATPSPNPGTHEQETWQCTFCQQHLVPKSWRRHEETQHRPKYQWTCLATSPRIVIPSHTGTSSICAFCQLKDPSEDHLLRSHRIVECSKKSEADRTFGRPDHLRQHIKNFHKSSLLDMVRDTWRRNGPGKNVDEGWTCGFCQAKLNTWDARETHIANHFKDGLTMAHWQDRAHSMAPAITENTRRSSHEEDTSMLAKLKTTLMGRPAHYSEQQSSPHNHIPATFDSPCPSTSCSNMSIAPLLPDFANMDFGEYMPDEYMNNFDFAGPSTVQGFDGSYMAPDNTFCNYVGDEALQMDLNAIVDPELYGNVMDFQSLWDTQRQ